MFDQAAKYMDHYERGLYNHNLATVAENDPETPTMSRSIPARRNNSATPT